jgi:hypothetical protein
MVPHEKGRPPTPVFITHAKFTSAEASQCLLLTHIKCCILGIILFGNPPAAITPRFIAD